MRFNAERESMLSIIRKECESIILEAQTLLRDYRKQKRSKHRSRHGGDERKTTSVSETAVLTNDVNQEMEGSLPKIKHSEYNPVVSSQKKLNNCANLIPDQLLPSTTRGIISNTQISSSGKEVSVQDAVTLGSVFNESSNSLGTASSFSRIGR